MRRDPGGPDRGPVSPIPGARPATVLALALLATVVGCASGTGGTASPGGEPDVARPETEDAGPVQADRGPEAPAGRDAGGDGARPLPPAPPWWGEGDGPGWRPDDGPVDDLSLVVPASPLPSGLVVRARATPLAGRFPRPGSDVAWRSGNGTVLRAEPGGLLVGLVPGTTVLEAAVDGVVRSAEVSVALDSARILHVDPPLTAPLAGEVVHFTATVRAADGRELADGRVAWTAAGPATAPAPRVEEDGAFVAPAPGDYVVTAARGTLSASALVHAASRTAPAPPLPLGRAARPERTGSLAGVRSFEGLDGRDWALAWSRDPSRIHVYDVTDPLAPHLAASIDAGGRVAGLAVGGGGTWAAVALLADAGQPGGLAVFDLSRPSEPRLLWRTDGGLPGGATAVAVDGRSVWAAALEGGGLAAFDLADPGRPARLGGGPGGAPGGRIADLFVRDGIAWLAAWHDGLIVLDVGAGIRGGTPAAPARVAALPYRTRLDGETWGNTLRVLRSHDRLLLADGIDGCASCGSGPRGAIHVLDVTDIERPREVARIEDPIGGARDLWVDEEGDLLVAAFARGGVRTVDLSGELRGELLSQGRGSVPVATGAPFEAPREAAGRSLASGVTVLKGTAIVVDAGGGLWTMEVPGAGAEPLGPAVPAEEDVLPAR